MKKKNLLKKAKNSLVIALAAILLCSCGSKDAYYNGETEAVYERQSTSALDDAKMEYAPEEKYDFNNMAFEYSTADTYKAEAESAEPETVVYGSENVPKAQDSRKIIYNSSYDIETKEFDKSVNALEALCDRYGAYFENANIYTAGGSARNAYYTIRVPVENYEKFKSEAGEMGVIIRSSQDNRDVTESYFDTEARLESAKIREERVLEILKNSAMLDDVLALERELADIRYEIESYTGTLRKYDSLVSYATVNINISEVWEYVAPKPTVVSFEERISSSFKDGINEFKESWQELLVVLSYNFIPLMIWLAVIVIFVIALRIATKKVKKKKLRELEKKEDTSFSVSEKAEGDDGKLSDTEKKGE